MQNESEDLITESEFARMRQQSERTIQTERQRGDGCQYIKLGHSVRYRRQDAVEFIKSKVRTSTTEVGARASGPADSH
jgi:hypothetical protein